MADVEVGQIDNYSFGRSGNSNILTNEIVYEPITLTTDTLNTKEYKSTYFFEIPLSTDADYAKILNSSKLLSILITTNDNFKINGIATSSQIVNNEQIYPDWVDVNYILNNSSLNIPVMKDTVSKLYLILDNEYSNARKYPNVKLTINGVWLQLNNADANFFQLQSQMAGLQMQASSIIQQLNNAMQYCNSITSMTSKYGVGDIYITTSDRNPNTIYGGTWEPQDNCILVGTIKPNINDLQINPFKITKSIPDNIYCRLESSQIPAHTHRIGYWT